VELNSDDIDCIMDILKHQYGNVVAGLEPSILGQCCLNKTMPKFSAVGNRPFVQILNVGDHWLCCTNIFSPSSHDVYVFDSMYRNVGSSLIVQVSSLLRAEVDVNEIQFHVRSFQQQKPGTRMCGFYAVAAAVSCVLRIDPTGHLYDETMLLNYCELIVARNEVVVQFPSELLVNNQYGLPPRM
jgi:hypothetical protein